jgi:iron(III) transport system permease protein
MLLFGAVTGVNPVVEGFHAADISIDNFTAVLANPNVHLALLNSFVACTGGTILALGIGLAFAWIVVRTNTPWKGLIATAGLLPASGWTGDSTSIRCLG